MRTLEKNYIDICSNFKYFLAIEALKQNNKFKRQDILYKKYLKFKYFIYYKLSIIKVLEINKKNIYIIYNNKYSKKLEQKVINMLKTIKNNSIELSDELTLMLRESDNLTLKNLLNNLQNNKVIYRNELENVIKYILSFKNKKIEEIELYLLIKNYQNCNKENIIKFAKKVQCITIVTYNVRAFSIIEEEIYNKYGIPIIITNNKRKGLLRAKYIINFDFNEDNIKDYNVPRTGILFNLSNNKISKIKGFNGLIINNILMEKNKKYNNYCFIYNRFQILNYILLKEKNIKRIIGNNGEIDVSRTNNFY